MTYPTIANNSARLLAVAFIVTLYTGCGPTAPHIGETVTTTTDSRGLSTTTSETRELLPSGKISGTDTALHEITAEVTALNVKDRLLTLRTADNRVNTFKVDKTVRNLPQVRVGDQISLSYLESMTFEVRPPTAEELKNANSAVGLVGRALPGQKPAGVMAVGTTAILTVTGIDKKNQTVSLRGPGGTGTIKAQYPENLNYVKEGDTVVVTASELLAAKVAPVS